MDKRTLGPNGPAVAALGRDCMGMSDFHGPADRGESIATIHDAIAAYGVLSRGLLSGHGSAAGLKGERDFRRHQPRFGGANLERNLALLDSERPRQA
jgi:aryl-alcohol dehydrogenase-like predicted oxidoreductase